MNINRKRNVQDLQVEWKRLWAEVCLSEKEVL